MGEDSPRCTANPGGLEDDGDEVWERFRVYGGACENAFSRPLCMMVFTGCSRGTPDAEFVRAACCLFIIALWIWAAWLVVEGGAFIGPRSGLLFIRNSAWTSIPAVVYQSKCFGHIRCTTNPFPEEYVQAKSSCIEASNTRQRHCDDSAVSFAEYPHGA